MVSALSPAMNNPDEPDGRRVLVHRLWPRGVTKRDARIDDWLKEIAPNAELGKWFRLLPTQWKEFKRRYAQ